MIRRRMTLGCRSVAVDLWEVVMAVRYIDQDYAMDRLRDGIEQYLCSMFILVPHHNVACHRGYALGFRLPLQTKFIPQSFAS